uniref:Zinc finger protein n=3 Tax=Timema TaxID=61471 RepID=A0A7R9JRH9_TIMGE|nr:unnamed protein product [Timema genevievae]
MKRVVQSTPFTPTPNPRNTLSPSPTCDQELEVFCEVISQTETGNLTPTPESSPTNLGEVPPLTLQPLFCNTVDSFKNPERRKSGSARAVAMEGGGGDVFLIAETLGESPPMGDGEKIRWVRDTKTLSRARLTLPANLEVQDDDGSTNVVSRVRVNKGTQFGPFQAPRSRHLPANSKFPLQVFEKSSKDVASSYYLDTSDEEQCNWMCLVATANSPKSQNLICYQDKEEIMFIAMKDIEPSEHLLVYYAPYYAMKLGKTPFQMEVPTKMDKKKSQTMPDSKQRTNQKSRKNYQGMLLSREAMMKVVAELPAEKLGARKVLDQWCCKLCGYQEASVAVYAKHMRSHFKPLLKSTDKLYCHACRLQFSNEKVMLKHKVDFHGLTLKRPHLMEVLQGTQDPEGPRPTSYATQDTCHALFPVPEQEQMFQNQSLSSLLQEGHNEALKSLLDQYQVPTQREMQFSEKTLPGDPKEPFCSPGFIPDLVDAANMDAVMEKSFNPSGSSNILTNFDPRNEPSLGGLIGTGSKSECTNSTSDVHVMIMLDQTKCDEVYGLSGGRDREDCGLSYKMEGSGDSRDELRTPVGFGLIDGSDSASCDKTSNKLDLNGGQDALLSLVPHKGFNIGNDAVDKTQALSVALMDAADGINQQAGNGTPGDQLSDKGPPFICDICDKEFLRVNYLYRHLRKHTGEFTCITCKMVFARKESLLTHSCFSKDLPPLTCPHCFKTFLIMKLLKKHLAKHTGKWTCKACKRIYSSKPALAQHKCSQAPHANKLALCPVCNKAFQKILWLQKHLRLHAETVPCDTCGKKVCLGPETDTHSAYCVQDQIPNQFANVAALLNVDPVMQGKLLEAIGQACCPLCKITFSELEAYRRHVHMHTHPLKCEECGQRFKFNKGRRESTDPLTPSPRIRTWYATKSGFAECNCKGGGTGVGTFLKGFIFALENLGCATCVLSRARLPTSPSTRQAMAFHLITATSVAETTTDRYRKEEQQYSCEICPKRFYRKDVLQEHHFVHQEPKFPCTICNKMLKSSKSLNTHMVWHLGKKRYSCSECGRVRNSSLAIGEVFGHLRLGLQADNAVKPMTFLKIELMGYKCAIEFFQKGNLLNHAEMHKEGHRALLECTFCSKSFINKNGFARHQLEHTQAHIYKCTHCSKSFIKKHMLTSHMRLSHSNHSFECPYCRMSIRHKTSFRRHLQSRHENVRDEWNTDMFWESFMSSPTQEQDQVTMDSELRPSSSSSTTASNMWPGCEVLLTVPGVQLPVGEQDKTESALSHDSLQPPDPLLAMQDPPVSVCNTYILEDGTIIQPEGGEGDILLYVLDTNPANQAF